MPAPPQLYLDTSVIGGYFDAEFEQDTRELWRQQEAGLWVFVTSSSVAKELPQAPPNVRLLFERTFGPNDLMLDPTPAVEALAQAYVAAAVVSSTFMEDAIHVALCALNSIDYLVSWNFKHLVNTRRAAGFNEVNQLRGYPSVSIISPKELIHVDESEKGL